MIDEDDRMIVPETQRYMAERMKAKKRRTPSTTRVTEPGVVVDMIQEAIRSSRGN